MNDSTENWAALIRAGDVRAISRAVTAIENGDKEAQRVLREIFPATGRAWKIGITGAAGAGKSTIVAGLAAHYRSEGKTVGVIAVDPSSPFTGGAILGDRIRMRAHATDDGVFIRSMASRGAWGGLAAAAADAALLLDASGKDVILLETVGVGQDEIEIVRVADCTLVVLAPGAGDEVQSLKAGLMEIADIFVLNKADYDQAASFEQQLLRVLQLGPQHEGGQPKIAKTIATETRGIDNLAKEIDAFHHAHQDAGQRRRRELEYWKGWLLRQVQQRVMAELTSSGGDLDSVAMEVATRKQDPFAAADKILAALNLTRGTHPK
jgi:LAO/AO transport system kinase